MKRSMNKPPMKNKKNKKNKLSSILVIIIFLLSSFPAIGQESPPPLTSAPAPAVAPGPSPAAALPPPDFSTMPPAEQQQFLLSNPNDPNFRQNAYNYLNNLGTTTFSGQDFEIAMQYVNQVDFSTDAQAVEIGRQFFSSEAGQVRSYIRGSSEQSLQAENFFHEVTGAPFNLDEIGSDFKYEEGQITNGGKTVQFTELQDVQFVRTASDGICITSSDGRNNCLAGDAQGSLSYDPEDQSFGFVDQEGKKYSLSPVTREGEEVQDISLEVDADGTIRIIGPARTTVDSEQGKMAVNNRKGTGVFHRDGGFEVENAEVIVYRRASGNDIPAPHLFIDGKAFYDASANRLVLQNHGAYGLGNARDGTSIGIYLGFTSSNGRNVGFAPDGDGKLTVNLNKMPAQSQLDPAPPKELSGEAIAEVLREKAKALPLQHRSNLGGDAVIDLSVNEHHELILQGRGPFEAGMYEENVLAHHDGMLYRGFRNEGDQFDPEFDFKINGEMDINMRGKGTLVDGQNGRIDYPVGIEGDVNTHNILVQAGFSNFQEGSSLAVRDNEEGYRIAAACFDCPVGKSTTMSKNVIFGKPVIEGRGLFSEVEATTIDFDFIVGSDNVLTLQPVSSTLSEIGDRAQQHAALGKSPDIVLTSSLENKEIEQVFRLSKPGHHEGNTIGLYGEFYEKVGDGEPQLTAQPVFIDFGASEFLGEEVVAVSEANVAAIEELVFALESGKEVPALDFEPDSDLEEMFQKEGIDIRLLDDQKYRETLQKASEKKGNMEVISARFEQRYRELYGDRYGPNFEIDFNDEGICVQPPDCQSNLLDATKKGLALAFDGSLIQLRAREAENFELEAEQQSLALDGKEDPRLKNRQRENRGRIKELQTAREKLGVKPPEKVMAESESDLKKGKPSEDFSRVKRQAVQDAIIVRGSDKVVEQVENQIEELEKQLREVDQMKVTEWDRTAGEKPIQIEVPASEEKKGAARAGINEKINRLNLMIDEALDAGDESYDEVQYAAAEKSNNGRYDEAADLLALIGDYEQADAEAQKVEQVDSDKGNVLRAQIRLRQGRTEGTLNAIAEAKSFIDKVENPELKNSLETQIRMEVVNSIERGVVDPSRDALVSSNSRFEGTLGVNYGNDWLMVGEALTPAGLWTADRFMRMALTVPEALGEGGFQEAGIMSLVENPRSWADDYLDRHIKDRTDLTADVNEAEAQLRALRASITDIGGEGDTRSNFERNLEQWANTACQRQSSNCAALRHLSDQYNGRPLNGEEQRELLAQQSLSELRRQERVSGEPPEAEEYQTLIAGYQGTQAAQVAQQEVAAFKQAAPAQILPEVMRNLGLERAADKVATSTEFSERYGEIVTAALFDVSNIATGASAAKAVNLLVTKATARATRAAALAARVSRLTQPAKEARLMSRVEKASGIPIGRMSRPSVSQGMLESSVPIRPSQIARAADTPSNDNMLRLAARRLENDQQVVAGLRARQAGEGVGLSREIGQRESALRVRQEDVANAIVRRTEARSIDEVKSIDENILRHIDPPSDPIPDPVLRRMDDAGELSEPAAKRVAEARTGSGHRSASNLRQAADETAGLRPKETPPPHQQGACVDCSGGMSFAGVGGAVCCPVAAPMPADNLADIINAEAALREQSQIHGLPAEFDNPADFILKATGHDLPDEMLKDWDNQFARAYNDASIDDRLTMVRNSKEKADQLADQVPVFFDLRQAKEYNRNQLNDYLDSVDFQPYFRMPTGELRKIESERLGAGTFGSVFCLAPPDCLPGVEGAKVIKIPHSTGFEVGGLEELAQEVKRTKELEKAGIAVPKIHNPSANPSALIKDYVPGETAGDILYGYKVDPNARRSLSQPQVEALAGLYGKTMKHGVGIDMDHPYNLIWQEMDSSTGAGRWVVVDPGEPFLWGSPKLWQKTFFKNNPPEDFERFLKLSGVPEIRRQAYLDALEARYINDPEELLRIRSSSLEDITSIAARDLDTDTLRALEERYPSKLKRRDGDKWVLVDEEKALSDNPVIVDIDGSEVSTGIFARTEPATQKIFLSPAQQRASTLSAELSADNLRTVETALDDLETARFRIPAGQRPEIRVVCKSPCEVQAFNPATGEEIPFELLPERFGAAGKKLQSEMLRTDRVMDGIAETTPAVSGLDTTADDLTDLIGEATAIRQRAAAEAVTLPKPKTARDIAGEKLASREELAQAFGREQIPFNPEDFPDAIILKESDGTFRTFLNPQDYEEFVKLKRQSTNIFLRWRQTPERIALKYPNVVNRDEFIISKIGGLPQGYDLDAVALSIEKGDVNKYYDIRQVLQPTAKQIRQGPELTRAIPEQLSPSAFGVGKASLQTDKAAQREVVSYIAEQARKRGMPKIAQRYEDYLAALDRGEEINLPKYFHASRNPEGIVQSGKVEVGEELGFKGVFVSSRPEVGGEYGDIAFGFSSRFEELSLGEKSMGENYIWLSSLEDVPLDDVSVIVTRTEGVPLPPAVKQLAEERGIKIVSLTEWKEEADLLQEARVLHDRPNLVLEGAYHPTPKVPISAELRSGENIQDYARRVYPELQNGELIIMDGDYGFIKIRDGQRYYVSYDLNTRKLVEQPLYATAKEAGPTGISLDFIFSRPMAARTEMKINTVHTEVEDFARLLADGEFVPVSAATPEIRIVEAIPSSAVEEAAELADTGRTNLAMLNAPSPTQQQIERGKSLAAKIKEFDAAPVDSPRFSSLAEEMHQAATTDAYGAAKLPEFERRLKTAGKNYKLFEVSLSSSELKSLNDVSYELGTSAIRTQHEELIAFARANGLEVTTLQKTTFIAIPEGSQVSREAVLEAVRRAQGFVSSTVAQGTNEIGEISLRVGIARGSPADNLMKARLQSKRSLEFNSRTGKMPTEYGEEVKSWHQNLPVEERASVNDIFMGYDSRLQAEFEELERLRLSDDLPGYRRKLSQLAGVDMQDPQFSSLEMTKAYLADPVTGVKKGDVLVGVDGIKVGAKNKEDVLRLTQQELPDEQLAAQLGRNVDENMRQVNLKMKQAYLNAIDNIKVQPMEVIDNYAEIARAAGYPGEIRNTDELKAFLKWEKTGFRGGDETFLLFRKEVLEANPNLGESLPGIIKSCGSPCGYDIRVGVKEIGAGDKFTDAIEGVDEAVRISKEMGDLPVRIDRMGEVAVQPAVGKLVPEGVPLRQVEAPEVIIETPEVRFALEREVVMDDVIESCAVAGIGPCLKAGRALDFSRVKRGSQVRVKLASGSVFSGEYVDEAADYIDILDKAGRKVRLDKGRLWGLAGEGDQVRAVSIRGNPHTGRYVREAVSDDGTELIVIADDAGRETLLKKEQLTVIISEGDMVQIKSVRGNPHSGIYAGETEHSFVIIDDTGKMETLRKDQLDWDTLEGVSPATIPEPIIREPYTSLPEVKANRLSEGLIEFEVEGRRYTYRPGIGYAEQQEVPRKGLARIFGAETVEVQAQLPAREAIALESSRLEVPVALAEESIARRFSDLAVPHPQAGTVILPQDYERHISQVVDSVGDGSSLNKENIKELVLYRARSELESGRMTPKNFENLQRDLNKLYDKVEHSADRIAEFSEILAKQTPGFTNVHLFRDGSVLGASDDLFQRVTKGGKSDVRIIYASRDTSLSPDQLMTIKRRSELLAQGNVDEVLKMPKINPEYHAQSNRIEMISLAEEAERDGSGFLGFQERYHADFKHLMETDKEFRETAQRTYVYLQEEGLLKEGAKLRFIDTCCTGTINYYLEGVVRYYEPNIQTESLLMESGIEWISADLGKSAGEWGSVGLKVEELHKPVHFAGYFDEAGRPLMSLNTGGYYGEYGDSVASYLEELVVLEKASGRARAIAAKNPLAATLPTGNLIPTVEVSAAPLEEKGLLKRIFGFFGEEKFPEEVPEGVPLRQVEVSPPMLETSKTTNGALDYLIQSRGIEPAEAARLIEQAEISPAISEGLASKIAGEPPLLTALKNNPAEAERLHRHFVGKERSLDEIISALDEDSTSLTYISGRGIPDVPEALVTIRAAPEGELVMDYVPLERASGASLESRISTANGQLAEAETLEGKLLQLYKERGMKSKLRPSGLNDAELKAEIKRAKDAQRVLLTAAEDSYRARTTGGEFKFTDAILVRDDHLRDFRKAVDKVKSDIVQQKPSLVVYSGRGGFPYEEAMSRVVPDAVGKRVLTSSAVAGEGGAYTHLDEVLIEAINARSGPAPVRVAIIEGAEYSGSSVIELKNHLKNNFANVEGDIEMEIVIYTFRQNQELEHFENMHQLTVGASKGSKATSFEIEGLKVIHKRVDVPFALGEDSALMLGQLPSKTKVEARVPVIIFDEEGNVVMTIEPSADSSTAQEFAQLLD